MMERFPRLFLLKAGKLGFTELGCAFDGWRLLYAGPNARVHLFSAGERESTELLSYVRFGLAHLPEAWRPVPLEEAGGNTMTQARYRMGHDDIRTIVSYPSKQNVSIDQSAQHVHIDELAHMPWPRETWEAVLSTIAPGGTCHVITRGRANYAKTLWENAHGEDSPLQPFFQPYTARPGRDEAWRAAQAQVMTPAGLAHFAPRSPDEALTGEGLALIYPMVTWDSHFVPLRYEWKDYTHRIGAVDLGGSDPQGVTASGIGPNLRLYLHKEYWWPGGSGMTIDDAADACWEMHAVAPFEAIIVDPPIKSIVDYFRFRKLPAIPRSASKWAGIEEMARFLGNGTLVHGQECKQAWREYQSYSGRPTLDPNTRERYTTSTPVDHHGEIMDCLRYTVEYVVVNKIIYQTEGQKVKMAQVVRTAPEAAVHARQEAAYYKGVKGWR